MMAASPDSGPPVPRRAFGPGAVRIVDECAEWLVVDKPAHMAVHPSKPDGRFTLWDALREVLAFELANGGQVSIINRLDRETSGLTLVAKTRPMAREFGLRMMRREVRKEYLAIVSGWPEREGFTVDAPLVREALIRESRVWVKQVVDPAGAEAVSHVRVLKRFRKVTTNGGRFSLVRVQPETGRMHQIRVHLASVGHPIIGDKLYGVSEECYLEFVRSGWSERLEEQLLINRQALHSALLAVPELGLEWRSDLPPELSRWIDSGMVE